MARIQTYNIDSLIEGSDKLVGTDGTVGPDLNKTKNFTIGDLTTYMIGQLSDDFVTINTSQTITGAKTFATDLIANSIIKAGGSGNQFLMANGTTSTTPTLQQVTDAENTIIVDAAVAKGIDITLSNNSTVYQNGIIITVPAQTGEYPQYNPAPDAFIAYLNGQNPWTLVGNPVGFVSDMSNADNIGFIAQLNENSSNSTGYLARSYNAHTGNLYEGIKYTDGNPSEVFKVDSDGDVTAKSFFKTGGTSSQYLMANGTTSTMPTLQQVTDAGAITNDTISINKAEGDQALIITGDNVTNGLIQVSSNDGKCIKAIASNGDAIMTETQVGVALRANSGPEGTAIYAYSPDGAGVNVGGGGVKIFGNGNWISGFQLELNANSAVKPTSGTWTVASDSRVKTNINPYTKGLETILAINPVTYDYNGKAGFDPTVTGNIGIIAQDILNIIPESINTYHAKLNEDDEEKTELYNFDSHALTFILINAVKQLSAEIELLKSK